MFSCGLWQIEKLRALNRASDRTKQYQFQSTNSKSALLLSFTVLRLMLKAIVQS